MSDPLVELQMWLYAPSWVHDLIRDDFEEQARSELELDSWFVMTADQLKRPDKMLVMFSSARPELDIARVRRWIHGQNLIEAHTVHWPNR